MTDMRRIASDILQSGTVIPAHPLVLDASKRLDERRMRALSRYYLDAGAGGLAVGVHTTQFEIRDPTHGLLEPVLELVAEEMKTRKPDAVRIAGICGRTDQALSEAACAKAYDYDVGLVSLSAYPNADNGTLIEHCRKLSEVIPIMGFYLQPAVGGRLLDVDFWNAFADLEGVVGIKVAPFSRYGTMDVLRGLASSHRSHEVALYTGNDDHIVLDLLTPFHVATPGGAPIELRFVGGLLGHWAVWTHQAVSLAERIAQQHADRRLPDKDLLVMAGQITEANQAIFDVDHGFRGCIPGIHEILRRQGLLEGHWYLDPSLGLSPGQAEGIDRICQQYPHLTDDAFVKEHLHDWIRS